MENNKNLLQNLLLRENNNFDLIRLIAAWLVIYGHANAMIPPVYHRADAIAVFLRFDYSGALAVKVFFFLSGLVVTNSLLEKKNILQFVVARFFRIWPAFLLVLFFTSFFIGGYFTTLTLEQYFSHPDVYGYIYRNAMMDIVFELPGVFQNSSSINNRSINGSIWSLPYELGAYILLLSFFILGLQNYKKLSILVAFIFLLDVILENKVVFSWRSLNASVDDLAPFFAFGALLALFKDRVVIDFKIVFALFLIYFIFRNSLYVKYIFYIFLLFCFLYIFSRKFSLNLKINSDISYGVYIWGWPIQQVLAHTFPNLSFFQHVSVAIFLASVAGVFSWFLIEKPGMKIGGMVYRNLANRFG